MWEALALQARTLAADADAAGAAVLARQVLDEWRSTRQAPAGSPPLWLFDLQATLAALGLVDGLLEPLAGAGRSTPWLEAARAFGRGDFRGAAEIYARVGAASEEAYARLLAAKALAAERRRSDADAELERALAFYRPVRATRYIRAAEALVTPTQATGATPAG